MGKYVFLLVSIIAWGISFWANINNVSIPAENHTQSGQTKTIIQDINLSTTINADLKIIHAWFCNSSKTNDVPRTLTLQMRPWQRREICIAFFNQWDKSTKIVFWFSKGNIDKDWIPKCDADMSTQNEFSRRILNDQTTKIMIPAQGNIIKKVTYLASKSASGNLLGCLGYKLDKEESIEPGNIFLITARKVGYIYVNISWSVYNFWRRDDIKGIYIYNRSSILKIIIGILAIGIIISIFKTDKKKENHHKKK